MLEWEGHQPRADGRRPREERQARLGLLIARWRLAIEAAIAPHRAERSAARLFFTPGRRSLTAWPSALPPARLSSVTVRGHRIPVWIWGPPRARTVLLAHGWRGSAAQLGGFVGPLLGAGFRVAAFDQPGHGASVGGGRVTVLEFRDATTRVIEALGDVEAVVAHSLGAAAAVLALAAGAARVARLALVAPVRGPELFVRRLGAALGLEAARIEGMLRLVRRELGDADTLDLVRLAATRTEPLLLLHDPADRQVPFGGSVAIATAWPGARLVPVEGAGHGRILRDPGVNRRVVEFVAAAEQSKPVPRPSDVRSA